MSDLEAPSTVVEGEPERTAGDSPEPSTSAATSWDATDSRDATDSWDAAASWDEDASNAESPVDGVSGMNPPTGVMSGLEPPGSTPPSDSFVLVMTIGDTPTAETQDDTADTQDDIVATEPLTAAGTLDDVAEPTDEPLTSVIRDVDPTGFLVDAGVNEPAYVSAPPEDAVFSATSSDPIEGFRLEPTVDFTPEALASVIAPAEPVTEPIEPDLTFGLTDTYPPASPGATEVATSETAPTESLSTPKLTPGPRLQPPKTTVHSGRASVAPVPFRFDEDRSPKRPGPETSTTPVSDAQLPAFPPPASTQPTQPPADSGWASVAPPAPQTDAYQPPPATLVTPPPVVAKASAQVPTMDFATTAMPEATSPSVTTPEQPAAEEPKPALLRPVTPTGVSGRARVAVPDPDLMPLPPGPPTEAERLATREAANRAAAQRAAAEAQRAATEAAARMGQQATYATTEQADWQARDQAVRDQAAQEQAARDQAGRERAARDQAAWEQATRDQAARDQAGYDQAGYDQAGYDQAARTAAGESRLNQPGMSTSARGAASVPNLVTPSAVPPYGSQTYPAAPPRPYVQVGATDAWGRTLPAAVEAAPSVPAKDRATRRRTRIAVLAGIIVVALAAAGFVAVRQLVTVPVVATGPTIGDVGPVLSAGHADAPIPTAAGVAEALAGPLGDARLGTHVTVQVADLATGKVLFGQDRFGPTTPASSMKLATAVTALALRGPGYRITTRVVAGPNAGEVVLIGAGDPTLGAGPNPTYPESSNLDVLAGQVKQALGSAAPTKVIIDTSLFPGSPVGPGWLNSDLYGGYITRIYPLTTDGGRMDPRSTGASKRYNDSALSAGQLFAAQLGLPASAVVGGIAPETPPADPADPTAPGTQLGAVQSAPLLRIIETMLSTSDNVLAEFVARQVAIASGKPASFEGAAQAVTDELVKMGLPMDGVHIVDGSGLSTLNTLTPALLSGILMYAARANHPQLHGLYSGLPVAGYSGTLADRFRKHGTTGPDGLLRAKTGTLTGVSTLAGTVIDASGRTLVFAVMLDQVGWNQDAPAALDKIGVALQACGCD